MGSRSKKRQVVLLCGVLSLTPWGASASAQIQIRSQVLGDRITILTPSEGSGNTIIFKGADDVLLIDTMADSIADQLNRALGGLNALNVRYIFNTHWHHNHTSGNIRFSDRATIFGAPTTRARLAVPQTLKFIVQETFPRLPEKAWPTTIFPDSMVLHYNGEEIRAWHVRGHTDTDVIVYLTGQKLVATGDLYATGRFILCDLDTGGNMLAVADALSGVLKRIPNDAMIVPGHGAPSRVADLQAYVQALEALIDMVRREKQAGRALEEIQKLAPPSAALSFMGRNPAKAFEAVYRSL